MPAQCRDEVGGNRPAKVDRHRCKEPVDMDGAVEAIMEALRDMAAQKALGHFVVVLHACDRAIPQRRLGRELDHRLLDLQVWPPPLEASISGTITSTTDRSLVANSTKLRAPYACRAHRSGRLPGLPETHHPLRGRRHQADEIHPQVLDVGWG